eukprot:scaffold53013_cov47-Phaeocystis_antarctica.AAC.3
MRLKVRVRVGLGLGFVVSVQRHRHSPRVRVRVRVRVRHRHSPGVIRPNVAATAIRHLSRLLSRHITTLRLAVLHSRS